ncbi:MAG: MFS transporter [Actinophytocola sp.]|uniref:MFS transporter n=1 Tax=Actinophytocola sp. TaxID=1872138 RepID=UPI0013281405|nr:MFS transporter [Actinophytocola sp.]MPZ82206.1 MFS transporter [Actinophytocola sp.]
MTRLPGRSPWLVVGLGFAAIVFDGYDLIVYGSAVPALPAEPGWGLTPTDIGAIGSYALLGMLVGAISAGRLTDVLGRRRLFIGCLAWFSLMMLGVALAPNPELLGIFRFLAGLGFGGIAPTAIALVVEVAPAARKNLLNAVMLAGFPVGGVLAAILAVNLLEPYGFRLLFGFGVLPLVTLVPLAMWLLPESPQFQRVRTRATDLLREGVATSVLLFAVANFCGFLLVFGLNTWLPQLMRLAGYNLGSALGFLLALNIGGVIGGLGGSALADRFGGRWVATILFVVAAVSLGLIAIPMPGVLGYLVVAVAGAASVGNQIVVYGYVATHYPAGYRATALGLTSGIGRLGAASGPLIGGFLVAAGFGLGMNVGVFAAVSVVGAVASALVPRLAVRAAPPVEPAVPERLPEAA